jgi:hypothetical protein
MGKIRKLSTGELDTRIKELSKEWIDIYKEEAEETGDSLDRVLRKWVQWDYEFARELRIHKNDLRALQTEDLINYLEKVLEKGLLKPHSFLEHKWDWDDLETLLFKNLKVSQIKLLPEKYQLLLGFRNGKRITEEDLRLERENTLKYKISDFFFNILEAIIEKVFHMYAMMIYFFLVVFFFIYIIFIDGPNSNINCANPIGDYQKDVCERAYERTFEEKWGRKPK